MSANTSTFLTPEEVAELTGVRKGSGGRHRSICQSEQLLQMGIHHYINAVHRVIVPRAVVEGQSTGAGKPPSGSHLLKRSGMNIAAIR
ncbi:DUF4224 domain-containing protein [Acidovorax sp. GBBC 1281]|uniref:DUF4224 domain-containing protein n=1 Tax=Acidovorax sp. SUPP2522 TaxID=511900 RepID=UPI002349AA37|nr:MULTISPECIES: DUF4224 domain-containing protein [unclassified Acidovorax]WCM99381.1 DUF4224 domain-containing protein [Acidovorax sp. GBBC 1281]